MNSIQIQFNGEQCSTLSSTVEELLEEYSLKGRKVAVERNKEIVPRTEYQSTTLGAGDCIEIVQFVGGG